MLRMAILIRRIVASALLIVVAIGQISSLDTSFKKIPEVVTSSVSVNQIISSSMISSASGIVNGQFEISKSGRYSLSSDIMANPSRSNKAVIYIAVSDVILDLGGKTLTLSYSSSNKGINGVEVACGVNNIVICNGTISGVGSGGVPRGALKTGIKCHGDNTNVVLENISITACYKAGVELFSGCSNVRMKQIMVEGIADPVQNWGESCSKYGLHLEGCSDVIIQQSLFNGTTLPATASGSSFAAGMYCSGCTNLRMLDISASSNSALGQGGGSAYGVFLHGCNACSFERVYAVGNTINARVPASQVCAGFFTDGASKGTIFTDCYAHYNVHALAHAGLYTTVVATTTSNVVTLQGSDPIITYSGMDNTTGIHCPYEVMVTTTHFSETITNAGMYPTVSYTGADLAFTSSWIDSIITCSWIGTTITSGWLDMHTTTTYVEIITTSTWIDTTLTFTWLDTFMTYSTITTTMVHWAPDSTITSSVYGFRLTESTDAAVLTRCSANNNEGGFTVEGFSCDAVNRTVFKECLALGNCTYATNANCSAFGFRSQFGVANQWVDCTAQGNTILTQPFSHPMQQVCGIGLRSEKFSTIMRALCESNGIDSSGSAYGIGLFGDCSKCSVQECKLLTNIGLSSYGVKDFAQNSNTLLRGNVAFGHGSVFNGVTGVVSDLLDTGSMNYMLCYTASAADIQQLIKEAFFWNMGSLESMSLVGNWYNISLTD